MSFTAKSSFTTFPKIAETFVNLLVIVKFEAVEGANGISSGRGDTIGNSMAEAAVDLESPKFRLDMFLFSRGDTTGSSIAEGAADLESPKFRLDMFLSMVDCRISCFCNYIRIL